MADPRRRLLLHEIELQSGFALKAYREAVAALAHHDSCGFWGAVQAMLTAAAQIQSLLGPAAGSGLTLPRSGALIQPELRSAADSSAFASWIAEHPRGPLRVSNLGPFGASRAEPDVFARYVDADQSVVIVFGRRFDIAALLAAIAELRESVQAELRHLQEVV